MAGIENKKPLNALNISGFNFLLVPRSGVISNFLLEDFEAVMKSINAETQKRKFKL